MSERERLLAQLQQLVTELAGPLPPAEAAAGWTEQSRVPFLAYFRELYAALQAGQLPGRPPTSLARELDAWGITGGKLLELAANVSQGLRQLTERERTQR